MSLVSDNNHDMGNKTHGSYETMEHIPVLLHESIEYLNIKPDGVYADGTLGAAGHAQAIIKKLDTKGVLIATDLDTRSIDHARKIIGETMPTVHLMHRSFEDFPDIADELSIDGYDGILLDLGWNSDQFADPVRGFSFRIDGPLDMRLDTSPENTFTAAHIVNTWDHDDLMYIFNTYADERWASRIAHRIIEQRSFGPIVSTLALADLVFGAIPRAQHPKGIHPATKVFQALRIAVNRELEIVETSVPALAQALAPSGRLCIITFHSGEDRLVKHIFKGLEKSGNFQIIEKKGIVPSASELEENPRARSARLRVIEKH